MKNQSKSEVSLTKAVALHQKGERDQAQKIYEEIIKNEPQFFDAIQLLGVVLLQKELFQDALKRFDEALKISEQQPSVWSNRGMALKGLGKFDEALKSIDRAIKIDPNFAESFYNKGNVLLSLKRLQDAVLAFDQFTELVPTNPFPFFLKGNLLQQLERKPEAMRAYESAVALKPDFIEAMNNLGLCCVDLGDPDRGMIFFDKILKAHPKYYEAIGNKGVALEKLGRYLEAVDAQDEALAINPKFIHAHQNKGVALEKLGDLQGAIKCYDDALLIDPTYAAAYFNRGYVFDRLLRFDEALKNYDKAISLTPDAVDTRWNRSLLLLCSGDYEEGWREYENRTKLKHAVLSYDKSKFHGREWLGLQQSVNRATILLRSEQGLGDTIQFCRYVKVLKDLGASVVLEVQPPLVKLLKNLDGLDQIIRQGENLPSFDFYCNLMSLPYLLGTTVESIPNNVPYLKADAKLVELWKQKLGPKVSKRVGLVWSGGFRPDQPELWSINKRRNIELVKLKDFKVEGVEFHSLQKGELPESELVVLYLQDWDGPKIINHADALNDFMDTAALIENLDLVISVDTSTAHLAGALGKPVWLMNRFDTCWRWFLKRGDSPWYPTFKIFRQPNPYDWDSVTKDIAVRLKELAKS